MNKCFACDKPLKSHKEARIVGEQTIIWVGNDCYRKIRLAGPKGWQPPKGGPKLVETHYPHSNSSNLWESAD